MRQIKDYSPSSCLGINVGNRGDSGSDMNSNAVLPGGQEKPCSGILKRASYCPPSTPAGLPRTGSDSPIFASCESLPLFPGSVECPAEGMAPLARFDTMSEMGSVSSFQSVPLAPIRSQPVFRNSDGYCYYVDEDLKSPVTSFQLHSKFEGGRNSSANNQIVTTAFIEPKPVRTGSNSSDQLKLQRDGSTKFLDRFGNIKGRTSTSDRYTLTYDSGSQNSVNKEGAVRPEQLVFVGTNGSSSKYDFICWFHGHSGWLVRMMDTH